MEYPTNPSIAYNTASIDVKQKFISSIFPNKLVFSENTYRTTTEDNSLLSLVFEIKGLKDLDKKKAAKNSGLSNMAPPLGLEPRTL